MPDGMTITKDEVISIKIMSKKQDNQYDMMLKENTKGCT